MGWVYFIWAEEQNAIKIGYAVDVKFRFGALQCGNPHELSLLYTIRGGRDLESALHKKFEHLRLRREWFQDHEEIHAFIDNLEGLRRAEVVSRHEKEPFENIDKIGDAIENAVLPLTEIIALPVTING